MACLALLTQPSGGAALVRQVAALPGYVWLDTPGKVLHVSADYLEFTTEPWS